MKCQPWDSWNNKTNPDFSLFFLIETIIIAVSLYHFIFDHEIVEIMNKIANRMLLLISLIYIQVECFKDEKNNNISLIHHLAIDLGTGK